MKGMSHGLLRALIRMTEASIHGRTRRDKVLYNLTQLLLRRLYREVDFTDAHGNRFWLHPQDVIDRKLIVDGVWEAHVTASMMAHLGPGMVFYDIGANIGYNTLLASRLVGRSGRVIAFEPNPFIAARLRRHVAANAAANVTIIEACVIPDDRDEVTLYLPPDTLPNPGRATMLESREFRPVRCAAVRLDDRIAAAELPRPDVVKIDVEGCEFEVLRSLEGFLGDSTADLSILLELTFVDGVEDRTVPFLAEHGFTIVDQSPAYSFVRDGKGYEQRDAVFVRSADSDV